MNNMYREIASNRDSNQGLIRMPLSKDKLWVAKGFIFLAAFLSMIFSIYLYHSGDTQNGIFVGIWVPSILSAGALLMVGHSE